MKTDKKALKPKMKGFKKVKACKKLFLFFCSLKSLEYKIFLRLKNNFIVEDDLKKLKEFCKTLKNANCDPRLPLFKIELYKKNLSQFLKFLKAMKNLDKKRIKFNALFFCDDKQNFCDFKKVLDTFKFDFLKTRLYDCTTIDYKLLCAINTFNLNRKILIKKELLNKNEQAWVSFKKQIFNYENPVFNNFCNMSVIDNKMFFSAFYQTYDYVDDCTIFKVDFQNLSNKKISLKLSFGKVFENFNTKNTVYYYYAKNNEIKIYNLFSEVFFQTNDEFRLKYLEKRGLVLQKNIILEPFEKKIFHFNFYNHFCLVAKNKCETEKFYQVGKNFKNLKLPKVLTCNKVLNYLLNEFLPNKIFEKTIISQDKNFLDFKNLREFCFEKQNVRKSIMQKNLNKFFLIQRDFFVCYFNLFYAFLGVWFDGKGLKINPDKSLVLDDSVISLNTHKIFVKLKKSSLENEVKLNDIIFTNLNYINLNNKKNKEVLDLQI